MKSLLACFLLLMPLAAWAQEAGKIDFVDGGVRLVDAKQHERRAALGGAVNEGDTVETAADGEVHIAMADGGQLAIRPNTQLRIQKYKAEGGKDDASVFSLLKGAMRSVTGWIGKYNPRNYEIRTPTATIGVRGTDHETRVIPEGSAEGEPGTYDRVNAGATRMTTALGSADIRPNQAGFIPFGGRQRPRLLERVPEFFRPGRNEQRFEGLHERIRERLDGRRQERIREIAGRRQEARRQFDGRRPEPGERRESRRQQVEERRQFREERRQGLERRYQPGGEAMGGERLRRLERQGSGEDARPLHRREGGDHAGPRGFGHR